MLKPEDAHQINVEVGEIVAQPGIFIERVIGDYIGEVARIVS